MLWEHRQISQRNLQFQKPCVLTLIELNVPLLPLRKISIFTDPGLCHSVTCQNGGTTTVSGNNCKCKCTDQWQGDDCSGKELLFR